MSKAKTTRPPNRSAKVVKSLSARVAKQTFLPVELSDAEIAAMSALSGSGVDIEGLARGPLAKIALENGEITERGIGRVRVAVKFLTGLLNGKRHKEAMAAAGLIWAQVNAYIIVSPEFAAMYEQARQAMFNVGEMEAYDTARELTTVGENIYNKDGVIIGKERSERLTEALLPGRYRKNAVAAGPKTGDGGGITLNFHFDGKGRPSLTAETVNV